MVDRFEGIFVSYRRDDSKHAAGRLVDRLATHFGSENLFLDVDSIALGKDFVEVLSAQVEKCQIMLVVIGPGWINASDAAGTRRLESPNDFVRIEVETALNRDIRVIPVLVDGALPFTEDELPEALAPLARRQAIRLDHESFHVDVDRLAQALSTIVVPAKPSGPRMGTGTGTGTSPNNGNGTATGIGTGTGDGTTKPVMSAKDLKDSVSPTGETEPKDEKPAPRVRKNTRLGWLVVLSPAIFAGLFTAYLLGVGMDPYDLTIWERYGRYDLASRRDGWSRVADGFTVFATIPVVLASLWALFMAFRKRLGKIQIILFLIVAVATWFAAANLR